jgi:hypothetical protein
MALGLMSIEVRKHNARAKMPGWWRRYFWSRNEFWAKHAAYKAARLAQRSGLDADGKYFFWHNVSIRAASFCEKSYGPVPKQLLHRPIGRDVWALSSPEITQWLRVVPPFRAQQTAARDRVKKRGA